MSGAALIGITVSTALKHVIPLVQKVTEGVRAGKEDKVKCKEEERGCVYVGEGGARG